MTSATICITSGTYRGNNAAGMSFQMVEQYRSTPKGGHVTVKNNGNFPGCADEIRIKVSGPADYEFTSGNELMNAPAMIAADVTIQQTDEERMEEIAERFSILTDMAKATISGDIRAMIVSGPPGVGKSYSIEQEIEKACMFDQLAGTRLRAEIIKGSTTALGLYCALYKYSDANNVLVLDDADAVFFDDVCLNLLKGALDTGKKRKISWLADSHMLRREGVPDSFEFKGSVIFITNLKFSNVNSKKLKDHLNALESRCHFVDLTIDTTRDKLLRIRQVIAAGMLDEYDMEQIAKDEIVAFITDNVSKLREVTLRSVIKIAQLRTAFPHTWEKFARTSMFKPE